MSSYLFLICLFGIAVVVGSSYNRHIRELEPALYEEYARAKFVPTSLLILLFLTGLLPVAFFRWTDWGIIIAKVYLPIYIAGAFVFFRLRKERKLWKSHLGPAFIRKNRSYDIALSIITFLMLISMQYAYQLFDTL